ncbi:MAG: WG repeat-containing protein [Mogibacterium sp.]|nr:WG repeat-containing protein [Mogibacterium sp.]
MKRLLTIMITLAILLCLGACGADTEEVSQTAEPEDTEVYEEEDGEEEESVFLGDYTIEYFQSGPLILVNDNKDDRYAVGALNSSGELVIPCKYDDLEYIGKDRYLASEYGEDDVLKYGIVDFEGNEIIPCVCSSIEPSSGDGLYCFLDGYKEPEGEFVTVHKLGSDDGEYISIIDGRSVSEPERNMMLSFDENEVKGTFNDEVDNITVPEEISDNYKDASGIWGIPFGSNECARFTNYICHYYVVSTGNEENIIVDTEGRELGDGAVWAEVGYELGNGLIAVRKDPYGPWALIDSEGNEVTDYIFDVPLDMS